ncbi:MAG: tRNA pseudouridine(54/55) synthase Pus10 [Nitrososphaerota archaeon]
MKNANLLEIVKNILLKYCLCDNCLGRQFSKLIPGLTNEERGRILKISLLMNILYSYKEIENEILKKIILNSQLFDIIEKLNLSIEKEKINENDFKCYLCENKIKKENIKNFSQKIFNELKTIEFKTFLIGTSIPFEIHEREDIIRSEYGLITGEDIKSEINREIGKNLLNLTNAKVDFYNPDVTIITNIFNDNFFIQINPVFIKGFYKKYVRNLPQSPWICNICKGVGCEKCDWQGRKYPSSISELIGEVSAKIFEAINYKFHAAGREDVDALVLGSGRPFVLEIIKPLKRTIDMKFLEKIINENAKGMIEVNNLCYTTKKEINELKIKSQKASKTYLAKVFFENEVDEEDLKNLELKMNNITIEQRTPTRVLNRRKDKIRRKFLYYIKAKKVNSKIVEFEIKAQGGLYIKELITGDNGRTIPSISEILRNKVINIELAVINIEII